MNNSSILCLQCFNLLRTNLSKVLNIQRKTKETKLLENPRILEYPKYCLDPFKKASYFLFICTKKVGLHQSLLT